ncbi:hypothetical protein, partial [Xanthomonas translucens]|uniref:hypothetical protein n=1 Tax=Xanthomonas campestris pv. translucens TaxID=343 RepID=UPI0019D3C5E9
PPRRHWRAPSWTWQPLRPASIFLAQARRTPALPPRACQPRGAGSQDTIVRPRPILLSRVITPRHTGILSDCLQFVHRLVAKSEVDDTQYFDFSHVY